VRLAAVGLLADRAVLLADDVERPGAVLTGGSRRSRPVLSAGGLGASDRLGTAVLGAALLLALLLAGPVLLTGCEPTRARLAVGGRLLVAELTLDLLGRLTVLHGGDLTSAVLRLLRLLRGWLLAGWLQPGRLLLRGRVLAGPVRCATELMGRSELDVARLLTKGVLPADAVIRTRLVLASVLALTLLTLLLGVPVLARPALGVVGLPGQTVMSAGTVALAAAVLGSGVLLSLAVLDVGWVLTRGAVHAQAGRLGGVVLLRVSVLARAVLGGPGLSVGGLLLRLRVLACTVLAVWVLAV